MLVSVEEAWWKVLRSPSEEARLELAKLVSRSPREALEEIAKRVGGELCPDTVIATRAVEVVVAALAFRSSRGEGKPLRVLAPRDPLPGWMPLKALLEDLSGEGLVEVYETFMVPRLRPSAREVVARVTRILRGFSARIVDITDALPHIVLAVEKAGAWRATILVVLEHMAVFQRAL